LLGWRLSGKHFGSCATARAARFALWFPLLNQSDTMVGAENILPPMDVIMVCSCGSIIPSPHGHRQVWHAYMLNPGWYAEDCNRIPALKFLKEVGRSFSSSLVRSLPLTIYSKAVMYEIFCTGSTTTDS
jgi:hypothetical protein